jgi:hypothetical protein
MLTQTSPDRRPVAKRWFVVLGALLAMFGAVLPWLGQMIDPDSVVAVATSAAEGDEAAIPAAATIASTVLVVLLAIAMLFGLSSSTGRGIRIAAVLMILFAVAAGVAGTPGTGLLLVGIGAILGFIGGVFARPKSR